MLVRRRCAPSPLQTPGLTSAQRDYLNIWVNLEWAPLSNVNACICFLCLLLTDLDTQQKCLKNCLFCHTKDLKSRNRVERIRNLFKLAKVVIQVWQGIRKMPEDTRCKRTQRVAINRPLLPGRPLPKTGWRRSLPAYARPDRLSHGKTRYWKVIMGSLHSFWAGVAY